MARCIFLIVFVSCAISCVVEARPNPRKEVPPLPPPANRDNVENQKQNRFNNRGGSQDGPRRNGHLQPHNLNRNTGSRSNTNEDKGSKKGVKDMDKAMIYMQKYGYIAPPAHPDDEVPKMKPEKTKKLVQKMQIMMGIQVTGELDDATMAMLDTPRCGVHDPVDMLSVPDEEEEGKREKTKVLSIETTVPLNFMHNNQRWPMTDLTYRILNYPSRGGLYYLDARDAIERALKVWSDVTPLTFTEVTGAGYANMYFQFGRFYHGDNYPFDGEGGTLAHAFLPYTFVDDIEGDVHFDDDEIFSVRSFEGRNLFYVAAHEIGHALGLLHSSSLGALMYPFINPYDPDFFLPQDDIAGIQSLYGGKPVTTEKPTTTTTKSTTTVPATTSTPSTKEPTTTTAVPTTTTAVPTTTTAVPTTTTAVPTTTTAVLTTTTAVPTTTAAPTTTTAVPTTTTAVPTTTTAVPTTTTAVPTTTPTLSTKVPTTTNTTPATRTSKSTTTITPSKTTSDAQTTTPSATRSPTTTASNPSITTTSTSTTTVAPTTTTKVPTTTNAPASTTLTTTRTDTTPTTTTTPTITTEESDSSSSLEFHSSSSSDYDYSYSYYERCPPYHTFFTSDGDVKNPGAGNTGSSCEFTFDAITSYRGQVFAFKNDRYWRTDRNLGQLTPLNGYRADNFFLSFPDNIDAAYEDYFSQKLLVFKGANYYVYSGRTLESGPQPITNLDPSLPSDVDAVLTWGEYDKTYFFKDNLVWRYDEYEGRVDSGWPYYIDQIWTGVPSNLTAAFRYDEYTNFIVGNQLYAYDDNCYYVNPQENPQTFSEKFISTSRCPYYESN